MDTKVVCLFAGNIHMQRLDIQQIVDGARETADSIVGARDSLCLEDALTIHDIIFWDMLSKRLPGLSLSEIRAHIK